MLKKHLAGKILLATLAALTAVNLGATLYSRAQHLPEQAKPKDNELRQALKSKFPVADFDAPEPSDPEKRAKRKARNRRHDNSMMGVKGGLNPAPDVGDEVFLINDWEVRVPALPASQSDVIITGEVLDANAFVSGDKIGVYSEFNVRAGEVFKNVSTSSISDGDVISTEREGGQVRYPSGRTMWFRIHLQNMPAVGGRYALFLKQGGEGVFSIITGYELRDGRVYPLDSASNFKKHEGADESTFLQYVREAIVK
jgi:hypothetical protein